MLLVSMFKAFKKRFQKVIKFHKFLIFDLMVVSEQVINLRLSFFYISFTTNRFFLNSKGITMSSLHPHSFLKLNLPAKRKLM